MKLFRKSILFIIVLLITNLSYSQDNLDSIQNASNGIKLLQERFLDLNKETNKLKKTNDSILNIIKTQTNQSLSIQKKLSENNYKLIESELNEIIKFEEQIKNYEDIIKVAYSGALINKLNSPTSTELGISFSEIIKNNCESILTKDLGRNKKNRLLETINRVINIPIVNSLVVSNPISSMVSGIFNQVVGFNNNSIDTKTIKEFMSSLEPYIKFHTSIDKANLNFENQLISFQYDLSKLKTEFSKYKNNFYLILNPQTMDIDVIFRKNSSNLNFSDYKGINENPTVTKIIELVDSSPNFSIDRSVFVNSYNKFIEKIIQTLKLAESDQKVKYDKGKIRENILKLETVKLK